MRNNDGPRGPVIALAEPDYRYGTGPLRIRIERVDWPHPDHHDGEVWYGVDGIELSDDGREVQRRHALVKASKLTGLMRNQRQ